MFYMTGTLGSQLQAQASGPQQQRLTRNDRILLKEAERQRQLRYEQDLQEAERLKREVFVDKPNDPFTFEKYKQEYSKLSPEIKQFFLSPEEITQEQEKKKAEYKQIAEQRIAEWEEDLKKQQENLKKHQEWWMNLDDSRRPARQQYFIDELRRYELNIQEIEYKIGQLKSEMSKIDQGYNVYDLIQYAEQKAYYDRRNSEEGIKAREEFNKQLQSGKLDEYLVKLGLSKNVDYQTFVQKTEDYNKKVERLQYLQNWAEKVGYSNLPSYAKEELNPEAQKWQKEHPTEILIFDKVGNVVGVQSGTLKQTIPIKEYNKIASKTPDDYYKEWEQKNINTLNVKDLEVKFLNVGMLPFEAKGTINTFASPKISVEKSELKIQKEANKIPIISDIGEGFKYVTERVHWDKPRLEISQFGIPSFSFVSFGKKEEKTGPEKFIERQKEKLNELSMRLDEWAVGKENIEEVKKKVEEKYTPIYQTEFEKQYMKKLIYGETDFETAKKEFEKSETAKKITERYNQDFQAEYKKLETGFSNKKIVAGIGRVGLGLGEEVLNIAENPAKLGVTAVGVGGAVKLVNTLPTSLQLGITGGFAYSGLKTTLNKSLTYTERAGGLVMAGLSGVSLTRAGIKYAKSPVVKTVEIPKPRADIISSEVIGKDVLFTKGGKTINAVLYPEQKLSQTSYGGSRTIVTTQFRETINKYLKTDLKPIYEGIPANQPAVYGSDVFRGGKYTIKPSGYEKAKNLLTKYGATEQQAERVLRYSAPKIQEVYLKKGSLFVNEEDLTAKGNFIYEIKQPVIETKEGIKTRGARTIRETYDIERKMVNAGEEDFILEARKKVGTFLEKGKPVKVKGVGFETSISKGKATETKQGIEFLKEFKGAEVYRQPAPYQEIYSASKGWFSLEATPKRKQVIVELSDNRAKTELGKTRLYEWEINFDKTQKAEIIKRSISKTKPFELPKEKAIEKVTNAQEKALLQSSAGLEKTSTTQKVSPQLIQKLKASMVTPSPAQLPKSKVLTKFTTSTAQKTGLGTSVLLALGLGTKQKIKASLSEKTAMQSRQIEKVSQISSQLLKQSLKQKTALKTAQTLKLQPIQQQIRLIDLTPKVNIPKIKVTPSLPFSGSSGKIKEKAKTQNKIKDIENYALFPDFTARAIGIAPQETSVKEALKQIKKIQTGFEIRSGIKIKEKDLLKSLNI